MGDEVRYVRLKPYDKKAGHTVKTYTHRFGDQFMKFKQAGIWNKVSKSVADELAKVHQIPERLTSPFVFDVCTEAEARQIDHKAKIEREAKKAVEEPSVDTAKNLMMESGRGDLSIEEVKHAPIKEVKHERSAALAEADAKAIGVDLSVDLSEEEEVKPKATRKKPKAKAKPKPKSKRKPKAKK